jgi:hypothetical protein
MYRFPVEVFTSGKLLVDKQFARDEAITLLPSVAGSSCAPYGGVQATSVGGCPHWAGKGCVSMPLEFEIVISVRGLPSHSQDKVIVSCEAGNVTLKGNAATDEAALEAIKKFLAYFRSQAAAQSK